MNGLAKQTASPSRTGAGISETLSKMKFMQNKKEAAYREELQAKLEKSIKDSHWVAKGSSIDGETLNTASTSEIIGFKSVGRMSFGNFNSNLDKLNKDKVEQLKQLELHRPKENDSNIVKFNDNDNDEQIKDKINNNNNANNNNNNNNNKKINNTVNNKKLKNTIQDAEKFLNQVLIEKEKTNNSNNNNFKRKNENNENNSKKKLRNK